MRIKIAALILMTLMAFLPYTASAIEDTSDEYILESYDIHMVVNENNTLVITERIGTDFKIEKHGITRRIPLRNTVIRLDGTMSRNIVKIRDISVDKNYSTYMEGGFKVIKIGRADRTITGHMDYTISYLYNMGRDPGKGFDELYFDLIGDQWDTTIENITFRIEMPKSFDTSKLGFSYGPRGSVNSSDVLYSVNGNVITGRFNGRLDPGNALTVRLELPEGYFVGAGLGIDWFSIAAIIIAVSFMLVVFRMWLLHGRDGHAVETIEFYPPGGLNSAEIGFYYKGRSDKKDVISLLIYLANKGYLRIIEEDSGTSCLDAGKGFRLVKLKEYDGDNELERIFFRGLFKKKDEVTYKDLHLKFYSTLNRINRKFNTNKYTHKVFKKASLKKKAPILLMILTIYCLITVRPVWEFNGLVGVAAGMLFPSIGFAAVFCSISVRTSLSLKTVLLVWGSLFCGIPWASAVYPALFPDPAYFIAHMIGIACIICMAILSSLMPKRTPFGTEILGKIKGFRTFLKTAEKPQLEALVMKEPSYFYDILPYTYVLGVSNKWIKKFETIAQKEPDWYTGSSAFDSGSFRSFTDRTMSSVSKAMSSTPPSGSSGGGGGSGGGSSGGGSGGGGGGSW